MALSVSVVIPVYNRADRIAKAVKSVLAQPYVDLEVIVADDGSTDAIEAAVKTLSAEDPRVRLVRLEKNRGAQAARNAGIRTAKAEWVAFLDSDDYWLPASLELRLACAAREGVEVVHSGCDILEEKGQIRRYEVPPIRGSVYRTLLKAEGPVFPTLLVRKQALEKIGLLDEKIVAFQEWDTVIRLSKFFRFGFVPESTFVYDCRGMDTISKQFSRNGIGMEQILRKHWRDMFFLTGPGTLVAHWNAIARWYEKGGDTLSVARCRRQVRLWRLIHPDSYFYKLGRLFKNKKGSQ